MRCSQRGRHNDKDCSALPRVPKLYVRSAKIFDSAVDFTELIGRRSPDLKKILESRLSLPPATQKINAALLLGEEWIPSKCVFIKYRRVCPICLKLDGWARCEWELKSLNACAHHEVELASECPSCHRTLAWNSTELLHCCCGQALSAIKVKPAPDHDVAWAKQIQLAVAFSTQGESTLQGLPIPTQMRLSQLFLMVDVVKTLVLEKHSKYHASAKKQMQLVAQVLIDHSFRLHLWEAIFLHATADPFTFASKLRLGQDTGELARNYSDVVSELGTPRAFIRQGPTTPITPTKRAQPARQRWPARLGSYPTHGCRPGMFGSTTWNP